MDAMAASSDKLSINRRAFLGGAAALVVPFTVSFKARAQTAGVTLGAYLKIDGANVVTVFVGSTEMGQGIMSGLAQLVAEELMLSWSQVRGEHALASAASPNPYGNPIFGMQLTGGSTSMRGWYLPMRKAAAIARGQLLAAAGQLYGGTWTLKPGGFVTNGSASYPFSALVGTAANIPPVTNPTLATTSNVIGKKMPRLDIPAKVDGSAIFGIDVRVPDMLHAAVVHCPTLTGKVASMPASAAGALALVNLGNAVGVVAGDTWTAMKIAKSLASKIAWTQPANMATIDSAQVQANGRTLAQATNVTPKVYETTGAVDPAIVLASSRKVDALYQTPFLAHACMEVLNCTARVTATSCEVWAPTQGQQFCIPTIRAITGLRPDQIVVHTTFLGGGLGRKIEQDYIAQAVTIAKAVGKPVKLTWSREQDFKNDKYRPTAAMRVQLGGLDPNGAITAMLYRNVSTSINGQKGNPEDTGAAAGALGLPYPIVNRRIEFVANPCDIPLGYWRSVGESYNTFAIESAIDELALALGRDPMALRKSLLMNDARARGVLDAVDKASGWSTSAAPAGSARGVAFLKGFGSYIALVVQVSRKADGTVKVDKAFCAIDCGIAINPDSIEAQVQGGIVHGLTATLWGEAVFVGGVPKPSNFNNYRVAKARDLPQMSVTVIASTAAPGGVGETGVPCVAPAIANAWAKLTGQRVRTLPFYSGATMPGL